MRWRNTKALAAQRPEDSTLHRPGTFSNASGTTYQQPTTATQKAMEQEFVGILMGFWTNQVTEQSRFGRGRLRRFDFWHVQDFRIFNQRLHGVASNGLRLR